MTRIGELTGTWRQAMIGQSTEREPARTFNTPDISDAYFWLASMQRDTLLRAVEVMATCAEAADVVAALQSSGFSAPEARVLADVLPEAFAVPVLEELGAAEIVIDASAKDAAGRWIKIPLVRNEIYLAALDLAKEHRSRGAMPHEAYRSLAGSSSLVGVASKALDAGSDLKGATIAIAFIGAKAEDFKVR